MLKFSRLLARGALSAGITVGRVLAQQILCVSQSQRKFSASLRSAEKLGMSNAILLYLLQKFLLYRVLTYYVAEKHSVRSLFLSCRGRRDVSLLTSVQI
jgi:hypothetical protein